MQAFLWSSSSMVIRFVPHFANWMIRSSSNQRNVWFRRSTKDLEANYWLVTREGNICPPCRCRSGVTNHCHLQASDSFTNASQLIAMSSYPLLLNSCPLLCVTRFVLWLFQRHVECQVKAVGWFKSDSNLNRRGSAFSINFAPKCFYSSMGTGEQAKDAPDGGLRAWIVATGGCAAQM